MATEHYVEHVQELQRRVEEVLEATDYEGLVLHSGTPLRYFADDNDAPFHATPHFAHWVPLEGPNHLLLIRPGEKPFLVYFAPEDYWYEPVPLGSPFWAESFEIKQVGKVDEVFSELPGNGRRAFHGDCPDVAEKHGFTAEDVNPTELVARLDWIRSYKTPYEIECIEQATRSGAAAHRAARVAFESGASELEIHHAYLQAAECSEKDLPYTNIIALNEKGAFLHYDSKRGERDGKVLLIDCGASYHGYACDITRTWTRSSCDSLFREMVQRFDALQQSLCAEVKPGLPFPELHHKAHLLIGDLLQELGVLRVPGEEAVERGLTSAFLPHGLGHFLGIQVHDVAGHQREPAGGTNEPPKAHPFLRTTRRLEENQVFTVEPGIYFIEMLLRPHRSGSDAEAFDWQQIERLKLCGGMRIEDNVVVTAEGHRNLTRKHLS
jgi:Xaa-Pro dipeptidase